jgi:hypothetical protein
VLCSQASPFIWVPKASVNYDDNEVHRQKKIVMWKFYCQKYSHNENNFLFICTKTAVLTTHDTHVFLFGYQKTSVNYDDNEVHRQKKIVIWTFYRQKYSHNENNFLFICTKTAVLTTHACLFVWIPKNKRQL